MSYYVEMANQALADYEASKQADRTSGIDALAIVKASGVRLVTHRGHRIVVVSPERDTAELRAALVALGYGPCPVRHLDTKPFKGRDAGDVAEALEDMDGRARQ